MKKEVYNFLIYFILGFNQILCDNNLEIVGGQNARIGQFPWQVSLQYFNGTNNVHFCGGSIISSNWVLTAAHCLLGSARTAIETTGFQAVAGITILNGINDHEQRLLVESFEVNSNFDQTTLHSDIALLKLTTSFVINNYVDVISLPTLKQPSSGAANVSGWGASTPDGDSTNHLQWIEMEILDDKTCQDMIVGHTLYDDMICTYENGNGPCDGDSGGPVVAPIPSGSSGDYLVGVVSWGVLCGDSMYPSVHTEVSYYVDWISTYVQ